MGGNALKDVSTRRMTKAEMEATNRVIQDSVVSAWGVRCAVVPSYGSKMDFGDLDVLVASGGLTPDQRSPEGIQEWAKQHNARSFSFNDNVVSFDFRASPQDHSGFQVDLIFTPDKDFDAALDYFSFNDLGNLIGRLAHKMGFSYGHRGMVYPWRTGDHVFRTLTVTQDMSAAKSFLGLDPKRYAEGFETPEDMFRYVMSSRFFTPEIFLLENRNHTSRTRDRKRAMYRGFLEYIAKTPTENHFVFPEDKSVWLPSAFKAFPQFERDWTQTQKDLEQSQRNSKVFNGVLVGQWTGLSGRELGQAMAAIHHAFGGKSAAAEYAASHTPEETQAAIEAILTASKHKPPTP